MEILFTFVKTLLRIYIWLRVMNCSFRLVYFRASLTLLPVREDHSANHAISDYSFTNTNFAAFSLVAVLLASEHVLLHSDLGLIIVPISRRLKMSEIKDCFKPITL